MDIGLQEQIFQELEKVRDTGVVNMADKSGVQYIAYELGVDTLAIFLGQIGVKEYAALLLAFGEWTEKVQNRNHTHF